MQHRTTRDKFREWLKRYLVAETLGTVIALSFAYLSFANSHSYAVAAGAGFVGEGIGFYGYFVTSELLLHHRNYRQLPFLQRLKRTLSKSSTNLIIEFAPAEVIDNIFIRPFLMFYVPQHVKPYVLGFIIAKFTADMLFYVFAILGYEFKKRQTLTSIKS